jgi:glucokinase
MLARQQIQMGKKVAFCNSLAELAQVNARVIAEAALKGDATATEVYRLCAQYLGRGLSVLIDVLNPEMIILGSIFGRARALLEPEMIRVIQQEAFDDSYRACQIVPAGLEEQIGDMAALCLASMISEE